MSKTGAFAFESYVIFTKNVNKFFHSQLNFHKICMCGNDNVKLQVQNTPNLLSNLVSTISKFLKTAPIVEAGLNCCHVVCLRQPEICTIFSQLNLAGVTISAMETHAEEIGVLKAGSMVIRNMVARTREYKKLFLEGHAEALLTGILKRYPDRIDLVEVTRAAIRDLDLELDLCTKWDGSGKNQMKHDWEV